jgi:hypothetical protein
MNKRKREAVPIQPEYEVCGFEAVSNEMAGLGDGEVEQGGER